MWRLALRVALFLFVARDAVAQIPTYGQEECQKAGEEWADKIKSRWGMYTLIVFQEDLGVCHLNRDYGVTGDPIYVGVFTDNPTLWDGVRSEFDPCALESAAPAVYTSGRLPTFTMEQERAREDKWVLRSYLPRRCYNASVDITVTGGVGSQEVRARYTLSQARRYRATLQLGVIFTDNHDPTFGLRPDGQTMLVVNQGPTGTGPEYVASVVLYSFLRYLISLVPGRSAYPGRDIIHDQGILDRIGGVVGVGLSNPGDRFVAGGTFDVMAGVNLLFVAEFAKVRQLKGINEGDEFEGTADEIPTEQVWRTDFSVGLSLDLVYVAQLFTR